MFDFNCLFFESVQICWKPQSQSTFNVNSNIFELLVDIFIDIFKLLMENPSKISQKWTKLMGFNWKLVNFNQVSTRPFNRNLIFVIRFELKQNQRSNLDGLKSESSRKRFGSPNRLSLDFLVHFYHIILHYWM